MASEIDICNIALGFLGGNRITSFTDPIIEAELCNDNYETSRNAVLEAVDWTFARNRAELPDTAAPIVGIDYSSTHQLPPDCVVVRWVSANGTFRDNPVWEKEGDVLLSSYDNLYIKYTMVVTDTEQFTSKMVHLVATQLAADICHVLTGDEEKENQLRGKVEMLVDQAGGADGVQSLPQRVKATTLTRGRFRHV